MQSRKGAKGNREWTRKRGDRRTADERRFTRIGRGNAHGERPALSKHLARRTGERWKTLIAAKERKERKERRKWDREWIRLRKLRRGKQRMDTNKRENRKLELTADGHRFTRMGLRNGDGRELE